MKPGTSWSVGRNSDHLTTEASYFGFKIIYIISDIMEIPEC
jgi:hypothetical protein